MNKRLFIIDGYSYSYQSYYAIHGLSAPDGTPTNAVFGFTNMLWRLIKEQKPHYLTVCFDSPRPLIRHDIYPQYKATRKPMPDDMQQQLPIIKEIIRGFQLPIYEYQGYEADDLIGTLALQGMRAGIDVYILSPDKDIKQIVQKGIYIYDPKKDEIVDDEWVHKEMEIHPSQIPDFLAIAGDSIDNIPGIHGVGAKGAINLLSKWNSLEEIYDHIQDVTPTKLQNKLTLHKEDAFISKKLAIINCDAPIHLDIDACQVKENREGLLPVFRRLGFRKFLSEILPGSELAEPPVNAGPEKNIKYQIIENLDGLSSICESIKENKNVAINLVTKDDANLHQGISLVGIALSIKNGEVYYIPIADSGELWDKGFPKEKVFKALTPVLENGAVTKFAYDMKRLFIILSKFGIKLVPPMFDVMIAAYLLNPSSKRLSLEELTLDYLLCKKNSKQEPEITACEDAESTLCLTDILKRKLAENGMEQLYNEIEIPLIPVLGEMELSGVLIKREVLSELSDEIHKKLIELEKKVYTEAGEKFNISSPKQLGSILFDKLGLPVIKKSKTGYVTNVEVLESLTGQHPLPGLILEYRQLEKLRNTYTDSLPDAVNPKTGRIHTSFNQTVTATGRLSSSSPNLQNIPIRTELGNRIREAFIAPQGYYLLTADYSQIELRMLAHLSKDSGMIKAFKEDIDIHAAVASEIFKIDPKNVEPWQRRIAKTVNFGIIYGLTPYGLSTELKTNEIKISVKEAKGFIETYFKNYSRVHEYVNEVIEKARVDGYVTTILSRRRYIPDIKSSSRTKRTFAERTAINTVVQGSAADLIKKAMVHISHEREKINFEFKIILQVHDELVFEVPEKDISKLQDLVTYEMIHGMDLLVPLKVNIAVGSNWKEAK